VTNEHDAERSQAVSSLFERTFGRPPDGIWAAPGRVNLIGEHTDYNDGFVLPFALEQSAYVALGRRADGLLNLRSSTLGAELLLREIAPGKLSGWAAYLGGAIWALAEEGVEIGGVDLFLDSDVPIGAGLSSSAAIECATILGAAELAGARIPRSRLARLAQRAETEIAGMPCGVMDQMVSLCAAAGHALFLDCRSLETEQVPLALDRHGLTLLVIDTRAPHRLVQGEYARRRKACEKAAQMLGVQALRDATPEAVTAARDLLGAEHLPRARHVVSENARVLEAVRALRAQNPTALGPLLSASHASLRDDFQVSVAELDVAAQTAVDAGALGARMIGGGFGGSVLALVSNADLERVSREIHEAFARHGFQPPITLRASAAQGARRIA
jgi:galactokinase